MRRRCMLMLTLALAGCMGFDEYYLDEGLVYDTPAPSRCGCSAGPHLRAPAQPGGAPPANSGSSPVPQSREPALLR